MPEHKLFLPEAVTAVFSGIAMAPERDSDGTGQDKTITLKHLNYDALQPVTFYHPIWTEVRLDLKIWDQFRCRVLCGQAEAGIMLPAAKFS